MRSFGSELAGVAVFVVGIGGVVEGVEVEEAIEGVVLAAEEIRIVGLVTLTRLVVVRSVSSSSSNRPSLARS